MEKNIKGCLVNAAWGGWYSKGSERLERSLIHHGWAYDMFFWRDEVINEYFDHNQPYTIKAAAIMEAVNRGYTRIIWADCSFWAVNNPNPIMDIVNGEAGYFWSSGYNLAQTAGDKDLQFAEMTRDYAEKLPELSSSLFGINIENPKGQIFLKTFLEAKEAGVFGTSREHNNASQDKRFKFSRQDQTAATIAFYKAGYDKIYPPGEISSYYPHNIDKVLMTMRGI
jgi:hypothetical protein